MEETDVLIIGAGPIGLACGIACRKRNLDHVILEKGVLVNSIYHYPQHMTFFSTSEKLEIGDIPFVSHLPKPTRAEALEYYRRVTMHWQLKTRLYEKVLAVDAEQGLFVVKSSRSTYKARAVIIASGFFDLPNLLQIPGEGLPKVHHYYKEPHLYFDQDIVVVGAANSAVDVALETYRKGARVTMVVREPAIQENVKYWVRPDIENRIEEGSISAYFQSGLIRIREREVDILTGTGDIITIPNDFVLAMTGYQPDFDFLTRIGITITETENNRYPTHDPETLESNIPGIYLAGVICGGLQTNRWFIENSRVHAETIVDRLAKKWSAGAKDG